MITFSRLGQTSLYEEFDPEPSSNFGVIGFLLPSNTPHLPPNLTLEESWYWRNQTLGAGWYLFAAPGQTFPDPSSEAQLLNQFIDALRSQLPGVSPQQSSGFAWIIGNPREPAMMSVLTLDMQGTGNRNSGRNPSTRNYDQSFEFCQFTLTIDEDTEARIKPDFSGVEILSSLDELTARIHLPVEPFLYRPTTNVTIDFEGEGRGGFGFTLEPLLPSQFGYDTLDPAIFYYLRPDVFNGSTTPRVLRYPLVDKPRVDGTFEFQGTLFPADHEASFFFIKDQTDGTPTPIASYFRTTAGFPVDLFSTTTGRFYLRPRPNFNEDLSELAQAYYLAPSGGFKLAVQGPLDSEGLARILTGFSGTEYIRVEPRNGNESGDALSFVLDQNAYAETFGDPQIGGAALLTPDFQTSYVKVLGEDGAERFYYAQPQDAPLFRSNGIFSGTSYLDFSEIPSKSLSLPVPPVFPITPIAGVQPVDMRVDVDTYKTFERDVLIQIRNNLIKQNGAVASSSLTMPPTELAQSGTRRDTTPQGLLVDIDTSTNRYTRIVLGKSNDLEMAIGTPTQDFQDAFASNELFAVISHLSNVGDFSDNALSVSGWKFLADVVSGSSDTANSIVILKFFDGKSLNELVNDTGRSLWAGIDNFNHGDTTQDQLKLIIQDVRDKAANPGANADADVTRYYTEFIADVIDAPNWAGVVVFNAPLDNPFESAPGEPPTLPRAIRGLLPGMVVTKDVAGVGGATFTAPTNKIDPAFGAHHVRLDLAHVRQSSSGDIEGIENSSVFALIDYENANASITGASRWTDSSQMQFEVDAIEKVTDFSFRLKSMQVTFENSHIKNFLSDVTLTFHRLFGEIPSLTPTVGVPNPTKSIDLSGSLQQINGILSYVFRFGCVDPLKRNFIVCSDLGLGDTKAIVLFSDVSPVITSVEATRVDYNMLQTGINAGDSNIAEFAIAGYMSTRELDGRDVFSYDRIGFGKLAMQLNYNTPTPAEMTDNVAKPEQMGNPFWIFTPNTMRFVTLGAEAREGSVVSSYPLAVSGIAESVNTFSAADIAVFPVANLVPFSKPMYPYRPDGLGAPAASPVKYVISYSVAVAGLGLSAAAGGGLAGGILNFTMHIGWTEGTWDPSGENVFYTALQFGAPLNNLDVGLKGFFKAELVDFGMGEVPTSADDRIFFIYVNGLSITVLKWTVRISLIFFAPSPGDQGFAGVFGNGGPKLTAGFGAFAVDKGSSGTSSIDQLNPPSVELKSGDPIIALASAALEVQITRNAQNLPTHYKLRVHGHLKNIGGNEAATNITVTARLYENGLIKSPSSSRTDEITFQLGDQIGHLPFEILFDQNSWPNSDETHTADVRITGPAIADSRSRTIRQTNTVTLRADLGKPAPGAPIIQFHQVAFGYGVRLRRGSAEGSSPNLNVHPAPRTVGDALSLMQQMLPAGESGPDLYNVLRDIYAPTAGFMVGVDITILGWLRLAVVVDAADEIYGGLIEIMDSEKIPPFAKKLAGFRLEILYRRISDTSDLGVFEGTLVLPDIIRQLDVGGFAITVPVISLQIYTDGGFLLDLGFPTGSFTSGYDFSRSFAIQGFIGPVPVMGSVGLYLGRLSAKAVPTAPDLDPNYGKWSAVWKFGLAAKIGFGKAYRRGPWSFQFSLSAQLIFQGLASGVERNPNPTNPGVYPPLNSGTTTPAIADFLMLEASLSIILEVMGRFEVEKAGFRFAASLNIRVSLGVQFRYMTAVDIRFQFDVTVQAQITLELDLRLFTISVSATFEFKYQPTFTIANNESPEWLGFATGYPPLNVDRGDNVLASVRSGRMLAGMEPAIAWTAPGAIWDSSFDPALIYQDGEGNDVDLRAGGTLPIDLVFAAPFTIDSSGALASVAGFIVPELNARFLHAGIFVWTAKMVLGDAVDGSTTLDAQDLVQIRDAVASGRQDLTHALLSQFLDANYGFTIHSSEDDDAVPILKPDGATATAATVFPMFPDYKLAYTTNSGDVEIAFDQQTLRDAAYYGNLDDYLEALLIRIEEQLGSGTAGSSLAGSVPTKPLATHIFEAFFELIVDTGTEQAIEAKVPRAAIPDEITDTWTLAEIVSDIIDRENPADVRALSGLASRQMMGGHQLPENFDTSSGQPPQPSGFESLYVLTGQEVPVELPSTKPDPDDDDETVDIVWMMSLKHDDDVLAENSIILDDYETMKALPTELAGAIAFGNDGDPRTVPLKPYLERNLSYPVDERLLHDSTGDGSADAMLMPFSSPLLTRLNGLDTGTRLSSQLVKVNYDEDFSRDAANSSTVGTNEYEWALIIPFTADKVIDRFASAQNGNSGKVYLKDTYKLGGADEPTRRRIAGLMADLISGNPGITGVDVLRDATVDGAPGHAPIGSAARILKTNLSTISAPRSQRALAAVSPPEEKFYGEFNTTDIFASLRLLWEASVVNAPGFFLEVDGEDGLPDDAFPEGVDSANLMLVIRFGGSSGIPSYANGIAYGSSPQERERFYVELLDPSTRTAIPVGVPGTIGFYIGRDIADPSASDRVRRAAGLFNLVAYRIKDSGSHAGQWGVSDESWSLPFGPFKLDEDQLPDAIKNSEWAYEVVVPWTKFLTGDRTDSPLFSTTGARSPYDLAGGNMELEFVALDTWGNQYPQRVSQTFDVRYTDALISISQWPEVTSSYQVNQDGQIVVILEFAVDRFDLTDVDEAEREAIVNRARGLRSQYETIWFQLEDSNTSVTLHTTLIAGNGQLSLADGSSINDQLLGWVEQILDFLNVTVNGGTATEPEMKVLTSSVINRGTRDQQTENIHQLKVTVEMSRPESMVDPDAAARLQAVGAATSSVKADTTVPPDLPELPPDITGLSADSMVGFAQRFEQAFPELRLAMGDAEDGEQTLWAIRIGRGVGASGPGIRIDVNETQRSFFAMAPLSTRLETCQIADPDSPSEIVTFSLVDMDKLGRRFVSVVDDMLSQEKVVRVRRADPGAYADLLAAKQSLADGIPNGAIAVFSEHENAARQAASRQVARQELLKSLSAAYELDTVISYDVTVSNSDPETGTPPNLLGQVVSLEPVDDEEPPFVIGNAKIRLGNDANGNSPNLSFTFATDRDSARAQIPAKLGFQVTYIEHDIQTDKPGWAPPTGSYEYRGSAWLKLIIPDNPRELNDSHLPNDPIRLTPSGALNVPIPLRDFPTEPAALRQFGTPEVATNEQVTLAQAAAWEYEYQIERPRAAQDRIYLQIAFNEKLSSSALAGEEETLLEALCRFDLMYSRLIGADKPIEEQTQPTPEELLTLLPYVQQVAARWGSWVPSVPVEEYTWVGDDWAYFMSEVVEAGDTDVSTVNIRLTPLEVKEPKPGQPDYGNFPEIRVPDPLADGPQELVHQPTEAQLGSIVSYSFDWPGTVPDNQTRSFVFSNLNVLKTENARGRMWLTRNENLGELDGLTTNERFIYRSGATEFSDAVQPFIDRPQAVDIAASVPAPAQESIGNYLEKLFDEVFSIAIDNGYDWPLTKIGCRFGYDPRGLLAPPTGPDPEDQFIVYLPVLEHVPFTPMSSSELANQIEAVIQTWESHWDIPDSPTNGTGFYEFDLSVFSTLNPEAKGTPVLRLRRLWIRRF